MSAHLKSTPQDILDDDGYGVLRPSPVEVWETKDATERQPSSGDAKPSLAVVQSNEAGTHSSDFGGFRQFSEETGKSLLSTDLQPSGDEAKPLPAEIKSSGTSTFLKRFSKHAAPKEWASCCGCHVRHGTIVIGVLYLLRNIFGLYCVFSYLKETDYLYRIQISKITKFKKDGDVPNQEGEWGQHGRFQTLTDSSFVAEESGSRKDGLLNFYQSDEDLLHSEQMAVLKNRYLKLYLIMAAEFIHSIFVLMMVYGAVKYKPRLMIPNMCAEIVFFVTISVFWLIDLFIWAMYDSYIFLLVLMDGFKVTILVYFIGICWRCYQFCKWRQQEMDNVRVSQAGEDGESTELQEEHIKPGMVHLSAMEDAQ